jgi:hypothetical protein
VKSRLLLAIAAVAVTATLLSGHAQAASASLYFSPGTYSVQNGNLVTVNVYENSGSEPVNAVQANFSYPTSGLEFMYITSSSAFGIAAQSTGSGGTVQIGRGAMPNVTGAQLVATVTFKAVASSGTATLAFSGGSNVVSANTNSNIMTSSPGGAVTLTSPPPATTPAPTPITRNTAPNPSTSSATPVPHTATPTPTPALGLPNISDIKVSDVTDHSATISWTTAVPAAATISYGLTTGYGLTVSTNALQATLNSPLIVPGTTYHFMITATNGAGAQAKSHDQIFVTKGLTLAVTVIGANGKPLAGAVVESSTQSARTNSKGQVTLHNLPAGNVPLTITYGAVATQETAVLASSQTATQSAKFTVLATTATTPWPWLVVPVVLLIFGFAIFKFLGLRREPHPGMTLDEPTKPISQSTSPDDSHPQ